MLKADFHIHTQYSMDSSMSLEEIIERCQKKGINCIAISDHGTIEGALKMKEIAPFQVIVAGEILTQQGEIMGMFLKEGVPNGLSIEETMARVRAQGALVNIPHPFDPLRGLKIDIERLEELAEQIDVMEVFNARTPLLRYSTKAEEFAARFNIPAAAGSDSHTINELGGTYIEIPEFHGKEDFLRVLRKGKIHRHRSNFLVHCGSAWARLKQRLT